MKRLGPIVLSTVLVASCNGQAGDGAGIGGETHFLITCEAEECGAGSSCIDGVCTRRCEPGFSSCSELSPAAACVSAAGTAAETTAFNGTCDVLCASDGDCEPLGVGYLCSAGACRAQPEAREADASSALRSARAPEVIAVDAATCEAGLRWVGGDHGSAEMHPGSDCLGCHQATGARPLMLGGTVYATAAVNFNPNPELGQDPLAGCFGLEGVAVQVTDGEGREYSTVTNRAGNFYVEGQESDLVLPYTAKISFSRRVQERLPFFGTPVVRTVESEYQMAYSSLYGGCARCHSAKAIANYPLEQPGPENVIPAGAVIFTPGLHPEPQP